MKELLKNNIKLRLALQTAGRSVLAFAASLVVAGVVIVASGFSPLEIYAAVFKESFSSPISLALCVSQATPLLFSGLSFAIGIRVGIVNTGVEGQLLTGAMMAALSGAYISFLPGPTHLIFCILMGAAGGGLLALFTTMLKVKMGASEVIMGIMLNNVVLLLTSYLANGPLKVPGSYIGQTHPVLEAAKLPRLIPKTQVTGAILIVIALAVGLHILLNKTVFGYKMRVTGLNRRAGLVAGINSSKVYYATSFIIGAVAGIGGACVALGVYSRFIEGLSVGYGFAGIPVAALAAYNPLGVLISGLLFGILKAGTMTLSRTTDVPTEIVSVIQALVVVFVSAPNIILSIRNWKLFGKLKKRKTAQSDLPGNPEFPAQEEVS